jgi:spore coat polysaccharide biosynthesis predicted glycosyltransferase SpsG
LAREWAKSIAVIDDLADRRHDCNFLLDQTPGRRKEDYSGLVPEDCVLALGGNHALLRKEFAPWSAPPSQSLFKGSSPFTLLIALGGTDPKGITGRLAAALAHLPELRIQAVVGAAAANLKTLRQQALEQENLELIVATARMSGLIRAADLAIGAGGVSALERCALGCPSLVMVTADNQKLMACNLTALGATEALTEEEILSGALANRVVTLLHSPERRATLAQSGKSVVDGAGQWRTAFAMTLSTLKPRVLVKCAPLLENHLRIELTDTREESMGWLEVNPSNNSTPIIRYYPQGNGSLDLKTLGTILPVNALGLTAQWRAE